MAENSDALGTTTILLAADSPVVRTALKTYLAGFTILQATDGNTALTYVRSARPSLVVADVALRGTGGLGLLRAIRDDRDAAVGRTPVVLLTGDRWGLLDAQAREAGATALVRKPVDGNELAKVLAAHLPQATAPWPW